MSRTFDIIYLCDFRFPGGTSTAIAEELVAGTNAGYRIALLQMKGPVLKFPHPFHPRIRSSIDAGLVTLVDPETAIEGRLILAHHPSLFTHMPKRRLRIQADQRRLVVQHPPLDGTGAPAYDWARIHSHAESTLGGEVIWAPVGPLVRAQFDGLEDAPPLSPDDWYSIIDPEAWRVERQGFVDSRPVIGRHSRPNPLKWPDTRDEILRAYPDDPRLVVRILGGGPYLRDLVGTYPRNWEVLPFNAIPSEDFLATIDAFVYYHSRAWVEAFGRTILEAMASGALTILPPHFRPLFDDGALYADLDQVPEVVEAAFADPRGFRDQRERGQTLVRERFSHAAYVRNLEAVMGAPRKDVARRGAGAGIPGPRPQPIRVLFMASNGVGIGHLTRLLAIARRCPAPLEPVFLTLSQAARVAREQGFLVEFLPFHTYLGCDIGEWNHFLAEEVGELLAFYAPRALVFDGHVPYGGLIEATRGAPEVGLIWCRRGMWVGETGAETIKREHHFDVVIEPLDLAGADDRGLTTRYRSRTRTVPPIRLLDEEDLLPREEARTSLGLDPERPAVLLSLGSGNNYDYEGVRRLAIERLRGHAQIVVAEWLIADARTDLPETVQRLVDYPISRYFNAFDFAISAVGYNSFHELLLAGVPSIFVPNEHPQQDDQLGRATFAAREEVGFAVRTSEAYRLASAIERLLNPDERDRIRARCRTLERRNGAAEAVRIIEELAYARRADRP